MIYYDTLNNAELFATYAFAKPAAWNKVIGRVVTHGKYGDGMIKEKDDVILRIQFPDQLKCFCELDFLSSDFVGVQFTSISLPPNLDRDELIDTLHCWEVKKAGRFYRGPHKHYRQYMGQSQWRYQQNLVKQEDTKIQQQQECVIKDAEQHRLREKQLKEQIVKPEAYHQYASYYHPPSEYRDEK